VLLVGAGGLFYALKRLSKGKSAPAPEAAPPDAVADQIEQDLREEGL
jgi:hypothetical protein